MEIIRDYDIALKKVKEILDIYTAEGKIKYSYIEKVKLSNPLTKTKQQIKDLFFISSGDTSHKPLFINGVYEGNKLYILHEDLTHYNMRSSREKYYLDGHTLLTTIFCNTVLMCHIWKNPETAAKILKGNLLEGNPNDSYRNVKSVEADKVVEQIYLKNGIKIKPSTTLEQVISRMSNPEECKDENIRTEINDIHQQLNSDHNKCYAMSALASEASLYFLYQVINKEEIKNGKYIVSNYYKTYDYKDIDETIKFERLEKDVCCIGLGSAGGNIIEQFAKLNYFNSYLFIDFDNVENKNLRNQPYEWNNIGNTKVSSMNSFMSYYGITKPTVTTKNNKYEDVNFNSYKFKYLISGFDTLECRKGVLEKIKSGEIETQYLIDARYKDLDSSLFIIDVNNKEQLEYYEKQLEEDIKEIEAQPVKENYNWTPEDAYVWASNKAIFRGYCSRVAKELGYEVNESDRMYNICHFITGKKNNVCCESDACRECIAQALEEKHIKNTYNTNSCYSSNIIHIYKITSAWVTSAIRSIETDNKKYFTHVDITTDPIPNAIVLKK